MNLDHAEILAKNLMVEYGLTEWEFEFDFAVQRAGCCKYSKKTITLSRYITEKREYEFVKDTILHEIAHALCPKDHHGEIWKAKAIEIGCNGQRCYTDVEMEGKYIVTCPNGHISYKNRKSKRMQSCGLCSNEFNPKFILKYKRNIQ